MRVSPLVSLQHRAQSDILYASLWSHFSPGQKQKHSLVKVCGITLVEVRQDNLKNHVQCSHTIQRILKKQYRSIIDHVLPKILHIQEHLSIDTSVIYVAISWKPITTWTATIPLQRLSDQLHDHMTLWCCQSEHENNHSWKKVNMAFRVCTVLSSTWTGPKHRSVGYRRKCHKHPALAGLSQTEGVTQKTAVRLTSVGSNQTQPAACQRSPTEPFSFYAWSTLVKHCWVGISSLRCVWYEICQEISHLITLFCFGRPTCSLLKHANFIQLMNEWIIHITPFVHRM